MANETTSFFSNLFDISVKEQVALALCNSASDTFFILSGPPEFNNLGGVTGTTNLSDTSDASKDLCPLLFTQSFTDIERKYPDPQIGSFGTANVITAPTANTTTQKSISIGAAAYVTTNPWALAIYGSQDGYLRDERLKNKAVRWNLLKRIYFWLVNHSDKSIRDAFLDDNNGEYLGDEAQNSRAVAPDHYAPWGNFAKSDIYKVPFGLMVLVAAKDKSPISLRYYEGCILQDVDGGMNLRAGIGTPTSFAGTASLALTYTKVRTFTKTDSENIAGKGSSTGNTSILQKIIDSYGSALKSN